MTGPTPSDRSMPVASRGTPFRPFAAAEAASSRHWAVPGFILVVSLALTGVAGYYVYASGANAERHRFSNLVQDAHDQATHSLERYLSAIRGATGLYAAFDQVDRRAFEAFAAELNLPVQYQGLRAIGFVARVPLAGRSDFLTVARRESGTDFHLWSSTDRPSNHPTGSLDLAGWMGTDAFYIRYVAPAVPGRRPSLGYDVASEPVRRDVMSRACHTAEPAVSPGLMLVPGADGERHPGFLIYVPVFGTAAKPSTPVGREQAVKGYVFGSFRTDDLLGHLINGNVSDRLHVQVSDRSSGAGSAVLFDSGPADPGDPSFRPKYHDGFSLPVATSTWTVDVSERPAFYMDSEASLVRIILVGGTGVGLVLFAVVRSQAVAHAEAERSAAVSQQAERALAASQSRLRRLVDANLIGVFFCDPAGEVSGGNDEFFRLLGQEPGGDGQPLRLGDITTADGRERVEQALQQAGGGGVRPAFETAFVRGDGTSVPVLLGVASVEPAADHIPGAEAVAFALDLTDRHRAERDLRQAMEAAETANRSKDQFLAVLSHELRTPLTPVLAATAAAAVDRSWPAAARDELAMIHRNVELEARLIDDLLDLTRIGRGKLQLRPETVDLHRVIADALSVMPPEDISGKQLAVDQDLAAAAHHVVGDGARLQQVVWNLVKNAVKFTPPGGRVTVRTANPPVAVGGRAEVMLEVADTGLGIEAEILSKVFDAFEQGSLARAQASGGLGLGLAISRGLVDAHGGRITAASGGTGQGATFAVWLATVPAPAGAGATVPAVAPAPGPSYRILLVEDHADTARVLARLLTRSGHTVAIAHTVSGARAAVDDLGPFDLLISDLGLPDGSGTDVVAGFRRRQAHGGAIALTGFGSEGDVTRTRAAGFDEHITKPVEFDHLRIAIGRVMANAAASGSGSGNGV